MVIWWEKPIEVGSGFVEYKDEMYQWEIFVKRAIPCLN